MLEPEALYARLIALSIDYNFVCVSPVTAASLRKIGRDRMLHLCTTSSETTMLVRAGIEGVACEGDPETSRDWIVIIQKGRLSDDVVLVSKYLGDPWEEVSL